jgi:hypothetical protein
MVEAEDQTNMIANVDSNSIHCFCPGYSHLLYRPVHFAYWFSPTGLTRYLLLLNICMKTLDRHCMEFSALWREAKLCFVLKFVGGTVVVVSDPCRVATFSVIGYCF